MGRRTAWEEYLPLRGKWLKWLIAGLLAVSFLIAFIFFRPILVDGPTGSWAIWQFGNHQIRIRTQ